MPHLVERPVEAEDVAEVAPETPVRAITRLEMPAGTIEAVEYGTPSQTPRAPERFRIEDVTRYEQDLLRRAAALTRRDMSRAQDLVQDCLERAMRNIDRLVPGSNIRAWLYTILANRYQDLCRSDRCRSAVPLDDQQATAPEPEPPPRWAAVTPAQVREALAELSPDLRATFELREFRQLSYEEIGRITGAPVATVGTRLCRARTKLREILTARLHLEEIE
jgi:RNA polymerase sigma-70 factor, ECF subfamily